MLKGRIDDTYRRVVTFLYRFLPSIIFN